MGVLRSINRYPHRIVRERYGLGEWVVLGWEGV